MISAFHVVYAPELTPPQYVAERDAGAERVRVVPSLWPKPNGAPGESDTRTRAAALCVALNRVYAAPLAEREYDVPAPGDVCWDEHDDDSEAPY